MKWTRLLLCLFLPLYTTSQIRSLEAVKTVGAVQIDASLNEAAWKTAPVATDFISTFPKFGIASSKKTEVKILYDNSAIYVAAYMYDNRGDIRRQLTQRDVMEFQDADVFTVGFDTYHDRQNAFVFQVSAAGVQGDARQSQSQTGFDRTWDAVWESSVAIKDNGWVAEIKIPFSALRFAKKDMQNWGIQFSRFTRKLNEESNWNPVNPNIDGTVNQWGDLNGLQNIVPPLRLSFLPYLSGGVRVTPTSAGTMTEYLRSGGMDVKYGINESFTLDMTLIPDFAQVRSDNTFLNLSPFQVKFDDFRPFFTEGTELFNKAGLFYSRRIGAQPGGVGDVLYLGENSQPKYTIKKNPGITRLYNATKLSGRTKKNLGIGVFNAITAPMYAVVNSPYTGKDSSILTEPLTNYNILVLDQALKNRSSITFTNTNVLRKGNTRNANVSAIDLSLFDKANKYNYRFSGRYSHVWGTSLPEAKKGFTLFSEFGKVSGKLQYSLGGGVESDRYDPNDLGFLQNNNSYNIGFNASYNINHPTKNFLRQGYSLSIYNNYLYKPFGWTDLQTNASAFVVFKNFWDVYVGIDARPLWFNDYFEARTPGVNMKRIPYGFLNVGGSTDSRKKLYVSWMLGFAESEWPNDLYNTARLGVRYRFSPKLQVEASAEPQHDRGAWGFAFRTGTSTLVPGYNDPVISFRDVRVNNMVLSTQYSFTPRMNWNIRLRHNWTQVRHLKFYNLRPDGYWDERAYAPGNDWNFNAFNIDMFYTWDFKWGSRLTFAWKNALGPESLLAPEQYRSYGKNLGQMFREAHSNEISLKIVYFLDYLTLRKRS